MTCLMKWPQVNKLQGINGTPENPEIQDTLRVPALVSNRLTQEIWFGRINSDMSMILNMLHMQIVTRTCSSVLPVAKYSPVDENSAHIVAPSCPCKLYIIWPSRKSQICRTRQDHVTRRSSLTSTCRTNQAVRRNLDNWVAYARYYKVVKKLTKRHLLV